MENIEFESSEDILMDLEENEEEILLDQEENDSTVYTEQAAPVEFISPEMLAEIRFTNQLLVIILYVLVIMFIRKIILSIRGLFFGY